MRTFAPTGLSLPMKLMQEIDNQRGDVPRSKYILRLIQKGLNTTGIESKSANIR